MQYLSPSEFLALHHVPIADVRSPKEFAEGHITGAVNVALFTDEERADVGTLYKHVGRQPAIEKGLEYVGPKMADLAQQAKAASTDGLLRVHCWRGGMRSEKMAQLFELNGLQCTVLQGGYKAYRQQLRNDLADITNAIILHGPTGSGKTAILHELAKRGEQIIDLEGLANHRGSAFGAIGLGPQPTTQQFHNDLYAAAWRLDPAKRVWIESESMAIGRVNLPEALWRIMNGARVFELQLPRKARVERLVNEYGQLDQAAVAAALHRITRKFGGHNVTACLDAIANNDLHQCADRLLGYYDRQYTHSLDTYKSRKPAIFASSTGNAATNADGLIANANTLGW